MDIDQFNDAMESVKGDNPAYIAWRRFYRALAVAIDEHIHTSNDSCTKYISGEYSSILNSYLSTLGYSHHERLYGVDVFALFNLREQSYTERKYIAYFLKALFRVSEEVPRLFSYVPVLDIQGSTLTEKLNCFHEPYTSWTFSDLLGHSNVHITDSNCDLIFCLINPNCYRDPKTKEYYPTYYYHKTKEQYQKSIKFAFTQDEREITISCLLDSDDLVIRDRYEVSMDDPDNGFVYSKDIAFFTDGRDELIEGDYIFYRPKGDTDYSMGVPGTLRFIVDAYTYGEHAVRMVTEIEAILVRKN